MNINLNIVGYNIIRENLELQLAAGTGPDLGFVTDLGGLNPYYLDLAPYVDEAYWEAQYGAFLPWYRAGKDAGIFGWHAEVTVTGPYANLTMFDEAGVEIPAPGSTWDDWAVATQAVMDELGLYAGMVMDRSGHRFAGPAMSYGAQYYDESDKLVVDQGFIDFAQRMVDWHASGLMPADIWPATAGEKYANGNEMFFGEDVPFYMSGSWNMSNVHENVGDNFDWAVVPVPCGPAGCGIMPGGSGLVAFEQTEHPEEVAAFINWMAETENASEWYTRTFQIPAHAALQEQGLDYASAGAGEAVSDGLNTFAVMLARAAVETPQAFKAQGDPRTGILFGATVSFVSQAMAGELTLDEAIEKVIAEVAAKTGE